MATKIKMLLVTTPQGAAGELHHGTQYIFNYTTRDRAAEVALGMPLRAESYTTQVVHPIFEMNRPEGYLLNRLSEVLAKHGGIDDMRLLAAVGSNTIGRVTLTEPNRPAVGAPGMTLDELLKAKPSDKLFEYLLNTYLASGISGVQPKVLVPDRVTMPQPNLIVKAQGTTPFLTQNEFICMEAAKRAGLEVPEFWLSDDGGLFIMKRFDRTVDGAALGFEDMAVLMGKRTQDKYQGRYENIAKVISAYCGENTSESLLRYFEYVVLSVMVGNGDAHLKNFGITYQHPSANDTVRLSPLYDVVSTTVYPSIPGTSIVDRTLALRLGRDRRYPSRDTLLRFGKEVCHVMKPEAAIARIAEGMHKAWQDHSGLLSQEFAAQMKQQWEQGWKLEFEDS
jgi:serine/threonine-protein kinase HipA